MLIWLYFAICVALIAVAGAKLSGYADVVAEKTGLGGTWIGLVMLASVTSLPELSAGITAVTGAGVPEIAVGDVLGSCVFNMLIIVVLDMLHREGSVYFHASPAHILSGSFGIMLLGVAGFGVLLSAAGMPGAVGHMGLYSPVIVLLYLVAMRTVFLYERRHLAELASEVAERYPGLTLRHALLGYAATGLVVVAAGIALPYVADRLAEQMDWSESFVGTIFVAFATSLPEIVTTIAAFRIGAVDMAISNLFGSNLFNVAILAVDDAFYREGPLLAEVSTIHAVSALSAMVMSAAAMAGILFQPRARVLNTLGWSSIALVVLYLLNGFAQFLLGRA